MKKLNKEQQQVAMLATILVIIVGVLLYFFRDKLLPRSEGGAAPVAAARLLIPKVADDKIYEREDYKSLQRFGDLPIRALPGGSPEPFITEQELLLQQQ